METIKYESSGSDGIKGMMIDIANYFKFALFTKLGLAMTLLCVCICMFILIITGSLNTIGIILTVLAFLAFIFLSWLQWFRNET